MDSYYAMIDDLIDNSGILIIIYVIYSLLFEVYVQGWIYLFLSLSTQTCYKIGKKGNGQGKASTLAFAK